MTENQSPTKKTLLVIEDEEFLVKAYKTILEQEDIDVLVARNGDEAIAFLERDPPDLVLLDLMLPGMDGFEVLQALRANEHWKQVPVIVTTNLGQAKDLERTKQLGATDYWVKADTTMDEIIEKVKQYLQ